MEDPLLKVPKRRLERDGLDTIQILELGRGLD